MSRILLDNILDHRFGRLLLGHEVVHTRWMGWRRLENGDLLAAAERGGFDVLTTGDKNLRYQQNMKGRRISVVILNSRLISMRHIAPLAPKVLQALDGLI